MILRWFVALLSLGSPIGMGAARSQPPNPTPASSLVPTQANSAPSVTPAPPAPVTGELASPEHRAANLVREKVRANEAVTGIKSPADALLVRSEEITNIAVRIAAKFTAYLRLRDEILAQTDIAQQIHREPVLSDGVKAADISVRRSWGRLYSAIQELKAETKRLVRFRLDEETDGKAVVAYLKAGYPASPIKPESKPTSSLPPSFSVPLAAAHDEKILAIRRRVYAVDKLRSTDLQPIGTDALKQALESFNAGVPGSVRPSSTSDEFDAALTELGKLNNSH